MIFVAFCVNDKPTSDEARLFLIVLALPLAGKAGKLEGNWGAAAIVNGYLPRLRLGQVQFFGKVLITPGSDKF